MSSLTNWIAINKKLDQLPPDYARTMLNWIRSFEKSVSALDIAGIMTQFRAHVADYNNPHKVSISELSGSLLEAVYSYYNDVMAPHLDSAVVIPDYATFQEVLTVNPMLLYEIIRDGVLNGVYQYQDLVGPRSDQPFYLITDTSEVPIPSPCYLANGIFPDNTLTWYNTLSRTFSGNGLTNISVVFGFRIISTSVEPAVWRLALNDPAIAVTYVSSTRTFHLTIDGTQYVALSANNVTMPINPSGTGESLELRGVLTVSPTEISLIYAVDGTLTKETITVVSEPKAVRYTTYTLSHAFWDNQTDETATTHLGIYPALLSDASADLLMSRV